MPSPTVRIKPGILSRLRKLNEIPSEEAQARLIGVDRTTLRRIDGGDAPSAAFIAGAVLSLGLPFDVLFEVVEGSAQERVA